MSLYSLDAQDSSRSPAQVLESSELEIYIPNFGTLNVSPQGMIDSDVYPNGSQKLRINVRDTEELRRQLASNSLVEQMDIKDTLNSLRSSASQILDAIGDLEIDLENLSA